MQGIHLTIPTLAAQTDVWWLTRLVFELGFVAV